MADVVVLTGIPGAGKSTVGRLLAGRFDRGVHVAGDSIRDMVVNGRVDMAPDSGTEATQQLLLRYQAAVDVADRYLGAGFEVVLEDVVVGEMVDRFLSLLPWPTVQLVVLDPQLPTLVEREAARVKNAYDAAWSAERLHRILHEETPRHGWWLDSTRLSAEQTVDAIRAHPERGRVQLPVSEPQR